jgi:hypothetical protein
MTQLSRKDFIKFAENISRVDVNFLSQTNPRFDAGRFEDYVESLVRKRRLRI